MIVFFILIINSPNIAQCKFKIFKSISCELSALDINLKYKIQQ